MNLYAIRAIYMFEMARTFRTIVQSIVSPVISTCLYFLSCLARPSARAYSRLRMYPMAPSSFPA